MSVEMVFNELSLNIPFKNKQIAREIMTKFIDTLRSATSQGVTRRLSVISNFDYLQLSIDYRVVQWRNDSEVEREERSFLRTLQARNDSLLPDIPDSLVEATYLGTRSIGLEYAVVFEALAVSLQSDKQWDCDRLHVDVTEIETEGQFVDYSIDIYHASSRNHVESHRIWIAERNRINIIDGSDFWHRRNELTPNLKLSDSIAKQIVPLQEGNPVLRPIIRRLFELEDYCKNWQTGPFFPEALSCKVTPESQPTLQKYSLERTFICPDGQSRLFSWHVRVTPLDWRIYFIPEEPVLPNELGKMIIGYIGPHLRTAKFN